VSGESASDESLTDAGEKLILGNVAEVLPVSAAVDDKDSASYTLNVDGSNCLNVRL